MLRNMQRAAGTRARLALIGAVAAVASLLGVSAALAIGNGQPDGNRHPYVGMLAVDWFGTKYPVCSGSYAGERRDDPDTGVFLTAGHCVSWLSDNQATAGQLYVTFDSTATYDLATGAAVTGVTTWYRAKAVAFDPALDHDRANAKDYGVVLLEHTVDVDPVKLPAAGLLDEMSARGELRPTTLFENAGYGIVPSFGPGGPTYAAPEGRMFSSSGFQALTKSWLKLLMNSDARGGDLGGICLWDSGSPKLIPGTDTAVAVTTDADGRCRAENTNQRLDVAGARAFLGQYLDLP